MRIKLIKPHGNFKAGREWDCPWASLAKTLIESGAAVAVDGRVIEPPKSKPSTKRK